MNEEEKKKSFFEWLFAGFSGNGGQPPAPQNTGNPQPAPEVRTTGSQPPPTTEPAAADGNAALEARIQALEEANKLLLEEAKQSRIEANTARIAQYVREGKILPAHARMQEGIRLIAPDAFDAEMEKLPVHPAFGGGETEVLPEGSISALELLNHYQAQAKQGEGVHAERVEAFVKKQNESADAGNALTRLMGGTR